MPPKPTANKRDEQSSILGIVLTVVASAWVVHMANDWLFRGPNDDGLLVYGIQPRSMSGLRGILFAPWLHVDWPHLFSNSIGFAVMGTLAFAYSRVLATMAILISLVTSGLLSWTLGAPNSLHVGASGVCFGLLGFLLANAIIRRDWPSLVIGIIVFLLYGGLVLGLATTETPEGFPVSWQGHVGGFVGGLMSSWWLRRWSRDEGPPEEAERS